MTLADLRDRGITRRCALLGAGGVGAAAVLAACSSGSGDDAAATSTAPSTAGSTAASTPGTSSASTPAASAATSASAGGDVVAALSDVPVGGSASAQLDGETVLLSQPQAGKVDAFSNVCPHQGGQVKPDGGKFRCSLHFSEFALDGAVTKGPAVKDLTPVAVAVSGSNIVKA